MQKTDKECLVCKSKETELYALAKDTEYFTSEEQFSYFKCLSCQSLSIDPVPLDKLAVIYPENYYSFRPQRQGLLLKFKSFLDSLLFAKIFKLIESPKIRILDVGGGEGWILDTLKKFEPRVSECTVVDLSEDAEALAVKKGHHYYCGKIEDFQTDKKFELILLLNLIEHIANPSQVLQKIYDLLPPGGLVLIKTPNYESLDAKIFKDSNWGGYHCPRHWVLFSMPSLEKLVLEIGFKIKLKKYTQGSPFWAWSTLHFLYTRKLINISAAKPMTDHWLNPILMLVFAGIDFIRMPFSKTSQMFFILEKKHTEIKN